MRNVSYKLSLTDKENTKLVNRAKKAGFKGRGAVVAYIRFREELPQIAPGAPVGNTNKLGKTKTEEDINHYETIGPVATDTRRAKRGSTEDQENRGRNN